MNDNQNITWHAIPNAKQNQQIKRVHIRWMIRRDMVEIYNMQEFTNLADTWSESDICYNLARRDIIAQVAEIGDNVVGWMIYALEKKSFGLRHLFIDPMWRRFGIGTQMIKKLAGKLCHDKRFMIEAEVRESNLNGLLFFKQLGFQAVDVFKDEWQGLDCVEDMIKMVYALPNNQQ